MFVTRTAEHIATQIFGRDPFVNEGLGRTTPAGFGHGEGGGNSGRNMPRPGSVRVPRGGNLRCP